MRNIDGVRYFAPSLARWFRQYATISSGRRFRGKDAPLSLEHFVQRQRALVLWKDIVRALNKIPTSNTRLEMRKFARDEYERNKDVTDIGHIRYLISTGRTQFDSMQRYIYEQAREKARLEGYSRFLPRFCRECSKMRGRDQPTSKSTLTSAKKKMNRPWDSRSDPPCRHSRLLQTCNPNAGVGRYTTERLCRHWAGEMDDAARAK